MSKHIKTTQNYTISFTTTGKKEKQPIKYCHILENSIYLLFFLGFHQSLVLSKKKSYSINLKNYLMLIKPFPP